MELKLEIGGQSIAFNELLIVPYGIETILSMRSFSSIVLLIVPYGIETNGSEYLDTELLTFNRTLWN